MNRRLANPSPDLWAYLVPALAALVLWAAWLGWDQHHDVHPDGSTTGPYSAWQVAGLVLTLLAPLYWAASRPSIAGPVVGITAGLTVAAAYDWSDDSSGLFAIGVAMLMVGSLLATTASTLVITAVKRHGRGTGGATGATT
ncbi:hypothetical protein ACN6LF_001030 [[Kitasatospora] papulosa]|jgi:flagellar biosynthesis protein FliR|uniref:hypothetical protein n=1 Tax=Streptomyces TaxID=1883 RepID=UPI0004C7ECE9|nr:MULTISPECIES: hypothetical protein [Streptomyces]MDF9871234.1 flagellar biosynthesis protein FliR [Streptomyces pratensis]TPN18828.1 hypothetical protein FKO01_35375 [Mesorhizobium sp. B2-3-3]WSZ49092.1 hypothetical protein OG337_17880 [[Kitasatospora] papulosa]MCY1652624.1 hypothetical protein [Streptomyces sp. SL203]MCY1680164.1 hypothetical protein [Streptomyces sp. SL294]